VAKVVGLTTAGADQHDDYRLHNDCGTASHRVLVSSGVMAGSN